jgi:hypothetical protein
LGALDEDLVVAHAIAVDSATVEHGARTVGCLASRARSCVGSRAPKRCAWAVLAGSWATRVGRRSAPGRSSVERTLYAWDELGFDA